MMGSKSAAGGRGTLLCLTVGGDAPVCLRVLKCEITPFSEGCMHVRALNRGLYAARFAAGCACRHAGYIQKWRELPRLVMSM